MYFNFCDERFCSMYQFVERYLERTHPEVHAAFYKGLFPVRRTDGACMVWYIYRSFYRTSADGWHQVQWGSNAWPWLRREHSLIIFTFKTHLLWGRQSVFEIAGLCDLSGDGHFDLTASSIRRNKSDIQKLLQVLIGRDVFNKTSQTLVSLSTGLVAESVNT